jgi:hypothetical protein
MRTRALFRTARNFACVLALATAASACAADPLAQTPEPLDDRTLQDAVLRTKESNGFNVEAPRRTENSGQLVWRTGEKTCAPLLDTIGRGDFDAVRSAHTSFSPEGGGVRPTGLTLGTYRQDGAKAAMAELGKSLAGCSKPFPVTGPMNRRYEATVQVREGLRAGEESRRFVLDMVPADSRDPHIVHDVHVTRSGSLATLATTEVAISGGLPNQEPLLGEDGLREFLQRQHQKLNRPPVD